MMASLSDSQLSQINDFITTRMGLHFPPARWKDLERHMVSAARDYGFQDAQAFVHWLLASPLEQEQVEMLASQITIGETYFWREPQVFEVLRDKILPELIQTRQNGNKRLRIWSAGCATGEEPYTIAILLRELIPDLDKWHITLLATDINPRILHRAAAGVYGNWSFRNIPDGFREKYFRAADNGKLEILPEIRKTVTFSYLNLSEDIFPSPINNTNAMDLIFCRNVLMYFLPEHAHQVSQRFFNSLVDGGWLMVAASELSQQLFPQFTPVRFSDAIVYRRENEPTRQPAVPSPAITPLPKKQAKPPLKPLAADSRRKTSTTLRRQEQPRITAAANMIENQTPLKDAAVAVRALANQGKLAEALAACESAIAADRLNPALQYLCAIIFQEQDRGKEVLAALKRVLYLDPNFVLAYFTLGSLNQRQGNLPAARKSFENALALLENIDPQDIVPESEGLTAGRLKEIIHATSRIGVHV